ncbi:hypothetical protein [Methylobacterium organophilum]|uniref:Lipoprotein n=1 Tax=Methylobacterium organophilum TaxID=410 RepID=A0ABQ4T641_METOR|nr:hypothetical protein [Methylobacterium organophilum]GJE26444.1 hypothetical protein LKMONMHP_1295 [Methylobacterium organophilum]
MRFMNGRLNGQRRAHAAERQGSGRSTASFVSRLALVAACTLSVTACVSPKEQRAMDQNQCLGFGFEPGTDAFAQCMMGVTQHREALAQERNLALQHQNMVRFWQNEREWEERRRANLAR